MKKFIFIALFGLITMFSQAQVSGGFTSFVNDTTTNTETVYMAVATPKAIYSNQTLAIELSGTNASGTATVTASLQVSDDNVLWYNYGSSITLNNAGTVSNYAWELATSGFRYYRVRCISSGTGVTNLKGKLGLKPR